MSILHSYLHSEIFPTDLFLYIFQYTTYNDLALLYESSKYDKKLRKNLLILFNKLTELHIPSKIDIFIPPSYLTNMNEFYFNKTYHFESREFKYLKMINLRRFRHNSYNHNIVKDLTYLNKSLSDLTIHINTNKFFQLDLDDIKNNIDHLLGLPILNLKVVISAGLRSIMYLPKIVKILLFLSQKLSNTFPAKESLRNLIIIGAPYPDMSMDTLLMFNITGLYIENISKIGATSLLNSEVKLIRLELPNNKIPEDILISLIKKFPLEKLNLENSKLTTNILYTIANSKIKELNIKNCKIKKSKEFKDNEKQSVVKILLGGTLKNTLSKIYIDKYDDVDKKLINEHGISF